MTSTRLDVQSLPSFRAHFGDGGDGLIREVQYDFARRTARIVLAVRRSDGEWVNLRLDLDGVDQWAAVHSAQSCWQVMSDGFTLLFEESWYLDLAPDFSVEPSRRVIEASPFHFKAGEVHYAEEPYGYPRDPVEGG